MIYKLFKEQRLRRQLEQGPIVRKAPDKAPEVTAREPENTVGSIVIVPVVESSEPIVATSENKKLKKKK